VAPILAAAACAGTHTATHTTPTQLPTRRPTLTATSWPTYHHDNARTGDDTQDPSLLPPATVWSVPVDGAVYAQPVVAARHVVVATENDSVYSTRPGDGSIEWRTTLGTPVALSSLPCGNIDPLGITGTPVADAGGEVFVAVETTGGSGPRHELVALDLSTGAVRWRRGIDPPGADPAVLQQRAALALANGYVYVAFGGLFGDCGEYRGWVVGARTDGRGPLLFYGVPAAREAGIWAPSGPAVDGAGYLYVTTGNGSSTSAYDHGNSVIKLDPVLREVDHFATTTFAQEGAVDADLGSTGPALLDRGWLFQVGKQETGYLLRTDHLGGIGGQAFGARLCSAFGGDAYAPPYLYVPCADGVRALRLDLATASPSFSVAWRGPGDADGPPIVAGGAVWVVTVAGGTLYGLDPASGAVRVRVGLGHVEHFTSPSAAAGLLLVGAGHRVLAFSGAGRGS